MKLSDYVAQFLARQGIKHVFAIAGGASLHLIHSLANTPGTTYICPQHEQAGAMAADAYSRVTGNLGAAVATSGPGGTNMITGVCCAYYDSVPVIYITGQVASFRLKRDTGVRQIGFQETDMVGMYRPITKYAVMLEDPKRIRYEMEKACYIAKAGRPGPVLIDIPDDLQRKEICPDELEGFVPDAVQKTRPAIENDVRRCTDFIAGAERPVIILGWGVRLAKAEATAKKVIEKLGIPVALTWAMLDMMPSDHPLVIGPFGTHGTRFGNFAVQNADLILTIGARLDTRETGGYPTFGRGAKKIIVDIDGNELNKFKRFNLQTDLLIPADAKDFLNAMAAAADFGRRNLDTWLKRIAEWKAQYCSCPPHFMAEDDVNPYVFVKALSQFSREGEVVISDTGCAIAWLTQAFEFKRDQRLFHDFNNTAMGYGLPASIGASLALDRRRVICVTGDGSLQMNIQELATVQRHKLPIKIFLLNNSGYSMIQQTQDQWLDSKYEASNVAGGLAFPDFTKVAQAYGYNTVCISRNRDSFEKVQQVFEMDGPVFCDVRIKPEHRVIPQVTFGRPIEDGEPLLDRNEFLANMIVDPDKSSLA